MKLKKRPMSHKTDKIFKRLVCHIALVFLVIIGNSCGRNGLLKKQLLDFQKKVIIFPENVIKIENGESSITWFNLADYIFVQYYGPEDCFSCAVAHLGKNEFLFNLADQYTAFMPIILFSPEDSMFEILINDLKLRALNFPVYVSNEFYHMNSSVFGEYPFNSFLLDRERHPKIVGDPSSIKIQELLDSYLSSNINNCYIPFNQ